MIYIVKNGKTYQFLYELFKQLWSKGLDNELAFRLQTAHKATQLCQLIQDLFLKVTNTNMGLKL